MLTFFTTTCETRCLMAVVITWAVFSFWTVPAVEFDTVLVNQWCISLTGFYFHTCIEFYFFKTTFLIIENNHCKYSETKKQLLS